MKKSFNQKNLKERRGLDGEKAANNDNTRQHCSVVTNSNQNQLAWLEPLKDALVM